MPRRKSICAGQWRIALRHACDIWLSGHGHDAVNWLSHDESRTVGSAVRVCRALPASGGCKPGRYEMAAADLEIPKWFERVI